MKNILIAGGTGLIGSYLSNLLKQKGYAVSLLSRKEKENAIYPTYVWDLDRNYIDGNAIKNADYIINLSGANIAEKRWSTKQKEIILESRTKSIQLINNCLLKMDHKVSGFFSASAVGYYGYKLSSKVFYEDDLASDDFLSQVCLKWENEVKTITSQNIRTAIVRTGVVLSINGGAFLKMLKPVQMGVGAAVGSGNQYVPWIHIHDLCMIYLKAIEDNSFSGIYNGVAPGYQTNHDFTKELCKTINKPFWPIKIPSFVLKAALGGMSQLVLKGNKIGSEKIKEAGFKFLYPTIKDAFNELLVKK